MPGPCGGPPVDALEGGVDRTGCIGVPSGIGVAGSSHSSVRADRSWRAGLPVRDRDRMVSAEVAANFLLCTGWVSSSVVSQTEPHQQRRAPWPPPSATAPDATSTEHRDVADGVDDLGQQHHGADLAGGRRPRSPAPR